MGFESLNGQRKLLETRTFVNIDALHQDRTTCDLRSLLECRSGSDDLVYQVLHRYDTMFAQSSLDDLVIVQRDSLLVDFSITSLVDEFSNGFQVGLSVCDVLLYELQHVGSGFRDLNEDSIVDL